MSSWVNRTVLSGSSVAQNGTNSHTCTFTAASSGNFLVAVVAGAVTFTTPSGWTLLKSAVNNSGLYVFTKTASASESSFSTTHNGSNYSILGVVYEYAAGTTSTGTPTSANNLAEVATTPVMTGLTGTYTRFSARSWAITVGFGPVSTTWTTPSVEDYDNWIGQASGTDGVALALAYDDNQTGSSFTPSSDMAIQPNNPNLGEGISFALSVAAPSGSGTPLPWLHF